MTAAETIVKNLAGMPKTVSDAVFIEYKEPKRNIGVVAAIL